MNPTILGNNQDGLKSFCGGVHVPITDMNKPREWLGRSNPPGQDLALRSV